MLWTTQRIQVIRKGDQTLVSVAIEKRAQTYIITVGQKARQLYLKIDTEEEERTEGAVYSRRGSLIKAGIDPK